MTNMTEGEEHATTTEAGYSAEEEKEHNETNVVRDSVTELLDGQIIPGGDFIHLYDTTLYHILNGHVTKSPCEDDSTTPYYYSNSNLDWFCSKHEQQLLKI